MNQPIQGVRPEDVIIVTRHEDVIRWLESRGITGKIYATITDPEQVRGKTVYGTLPNSLACEATALVNLEMPAMLPEQKGRNLSVEEMDAAGAVLVTYVIVKI